MFQALTGVVTPFAAGYLCHSHCEVPCSAELGSAHRRFKLGVVVHEVHLETCGKPGALLHARPYVQFSVGDKQKETELADWSVELACWMLAETIIFEVGLDSDIRVSVCCATRYDLYVATVSTRTTCLGTLSLPVASVLRRMQQADRDTDGIVFATPLLGFDIVQDGRFHGRLFLSFESKTPPPPMPSTGSDDFSCNACDCYPQMQAPRLAAHGDGADAKARAAAASRVPGSASSPPIEELRLHCQDFKLDANDQDSFPHGGQSACQGPRTPLPADWWAPGNSPGGDEVFLPDWAQGHSRTDALASGVKSSVTPSDGSPESSAQVPHWQLNAWRYSKLSRGV
eukprot:TRINITY_DN92794_c0_g1_i1.p1 TRINITY_DN92794_c0_g1~~TRINITY_DN92794_c0_g1_i1.p1  ORF type:complete len:342 (-),score=31.90 TRINITY_DN92794_c0_g1_i1:32-1057(-)